MPKIQASLCVIIKPGQHPIGEKMKKFIILVIGSFLFAYSVFAAEFVHPLNFKGTDTEKKAVIEYIKKHVKKTYSKIGMDSDSTLRMMEKEELKSFKELMKAENRKILNRVIKTYCNIGMCSYSTINMMYKEEIKASKEKLEW